MRLLTFFPMDNDIKKTLWAAADKLRSNMDAAEYKHIVLGLVLRQPETLAETWI